MADILALFLPQGGWWGLLVGFAAEVFRGWLSDRRSADAMREAGAADAVAKGKAAAEEQEARAREAAEKAESQSPTVLIEDDEFMRRDP